MKTTASRASAVSQTRGFGDLLYDKAGARPSLDLDFAGTNSLRDKVTGEYLVDHTSSTSATFINSEGLIESSYRNYLGASESLDETQYTHLAFNNTCVVVDNTDGVYTPRGQLAKILKPNQSGTQPNPNTNNPPDSPRISWNNYLVQTGLTITKSIYAKMPTNGYRYLAHYGWAGANVSTAAILYDLQEGVVTSPQYYPDNQNSRDRTSWGMIDVGGGWYRCWITITNTSAYPTANWILNKTGSLSVYEDGYYDSGSWDINKGIYIAHPQLNLGELKDYVVNNPSANHSPRFTHERVETGNLIEDSNLNQSVISRTFVSVENYAGLAPDGSYSATKISSTNGGAGFRFGAIVPTKDISHIPIKTVSCYFKAGEVDRVSLFVSNSGNLGARFTLTGDGIAVAVGSENTARITKADNGWYRCEVTNNNYAINQFRIGVDFGAIQGVSIPVGNGIYAWGFQIEEGDSASAFVPSIDTWTSRASSATYVDSAGLVRYKPINYLRYNEQMHQWATVNISSTANATTAPDGSQNATKIVPINGNALHHIKVVNTGQNGIWVITCYVKAAGLNYVQLLAEPVGTSVYGATFNLANGTVHDTKSATGEIIDVGDGWFRCIVYLTTFFGAYNVWIAPSDGNNNATFKPTFSGNNVDGIFVWGANSHALKGIAGDHIKTESTVGVTAPRYSHDPETLTPTGLYLEPASTNHAEYLTTYYVAPSVLNPSGGYGAFGNFNNSCYFLTNNFTPVNGQNITVSYWAKQSPDATINSISKLTPFRWGSSAAAQGNYYIDLSNGTIATPLLNSGNNPNTATADNTTITPYPNGWYRITHKVPMDSTWTTNSSFAFMAYNGGHANAHSDVHYYWGFQVEHGDTASSYIPQTLDNTASVTRAADVYTSTANLTETFEPRGLLIEEARTNLVPTHNATTAHSNTTLFTNVATAPDGTQTASRIRENNSASNTIQYASNPLGNAIPVNSTVSGFFKAETIRYVGVITHTATNYVPFIIDLQEGVITQKNNNYTTYKLEKYPNGWYRFSYLATLQTNGNFLIIPFLTPTGQSPSIINITQRAGNTNNKFLFWGLQVEQGLFPTSPILTSGSTVTRSADVVSISGDNFGTYRTNLLTHSNLPRQETFNGTNGIERLIPISNYGLSPSGKYDSTKLIPNTDNSGIKRIYWSGFTANVANRKTFSLYAKASGFRFLHIRNRNHGKCFDLINGTMSTGYRDGNVQLSVPDAAAMEDVGNGWYRCSVTSPTTTNFVHAHPSDSATTTVVIGNGTDGIEVYGAQVEEGYLTNYIPSIEKLSSRLGKATYVDSNGLIKTANLNYTTYNQQPSTYGGYGTGNQTEVVTTEVNPPIEAPWLTQVLKVTYTASGYRHRGHGASGINLNGLHTISVFVKQGTASKIKIGTFSNGGATFEFATETFSGLHSTMSNAGFTKLNDGWYRLFVTVNYNNTLGITGHGASNNAPDMLGTSYWTGWQLEEGSEVTDINIITGNVRSGGPRYSHDPETLVPTGLILEPARTNFFRTWTTNNTSPNIPYITYAANGQNGQAQISTEVTAPDGTDKTLKVSWDNYGSTGHGYFRVGNNSSSTQGLGTLNAGTYTFSFFIKRGNDGNHNADDLLDGTYGAGNASYQVIFQDFSESPQGPHINIQNPNVDKRIVKYPNGWYRVSTTFTTSQSYAFDNGGVSHYTLNTAVLKAYYEAMPIYYWGFQLEEGNFETSHIDQGYLAQITRPVDTFNSTATTVLDRKGGDQEGVLSSNGFSVFTNHNSMVNSNNRLWNLRQNTSSNSSVGVYGAAGLFISYNDNINASVVANNASQSISLGYVTKFKNAKVAYNASLTSINGSLNGNTVQTGTYSASSLDFNLSDSNAFKISSFHDGANKYIGTLDRMTFWNKPIENQQLINITT